jgi:hypothetical protein
MNGDGPLSVDVSCASGSCQVIGATSSANWVSIRKKQAKRQGRHMAGEDSVKATKPLQVR